MARAAYLAPGVYVEEVPSAQQPIAGVGTNTVGFIGVVPDEIQCPVPNEEYDPTLALAAAAGPATAASANVGSYASFGTGHWISSGTTPMNPTVFVPTPAIGC